MFMGAMDKLNILKATQTHQRDGPLLESEKQILSNSFLTDNYTQKNYYLSFLNHWETGKLGQQNGKMERKNKEHLDVDLGGDFGGILYCCCFIIYLHVLCNFTVLVLQLNFYFEEVSKRGSRIWVNGLLMIKIKELEKIHNALNKNFMKTT